MRPLQEQGPQEREEDQLDAADVIRCVSVLERMMRHEGTRTAWIMGFLVGSSVAGTTLPVPATPPAWR
jgi:hypothetical protein